MKIVIKLSLLLAALTAVLVSAGYILVGTSGLTVGLFFALLFDFVGYFLSDKLFITFSNAIEIEEDDMPWLHKSVAGLAEKMDIPKPHIYLLPEEQPNACATGRNKKHAIIAVTSGLLKTLEKEEIEAVVAHELAHIKYHDILIGAVAGMIGSAVSILAYIGYAIISANRRDNNASIDNALMSVMYIILAPLLAVVIRSSISRSREYNADKIAASFTSSERMIAALTKLDQGTRAVELSKFSPATAHLYIISPTRSSILNKLISTHPSLEQRVKRLQTV
jgi:heat shock protein HtpX